ncbi:nucleotide exchange factor GrpE [bacterium]|nr:nucleotide exchange factor GrpE [bacterium]
MDEEKLEEAKNPTEEDNPEDEKCRDVLARTMADFENFKKRTQRDKQDMIFFLKQDIFKKILPRLDDLDRIINNTPEEMKAGAVYE